MEIVKPQKGTSWTGILTSMQIGEKIPAGMEDRNTVAPLISRQLKLSHPNMGWKTEKEKENKTTFNIIRIR